MKTDEIKSEVIFYCKAEYTEPMHRSFISDGFIDQNEHTNLKLTFDRRNGKFELISAEVI